MGIFDKLIGKKQDIAESNIPAKKKQTSAPSIKIMDGAYYVITSSEGLRTIKSTIGFNPTLSRLTWCRIQFKKDTWLSVGIDIPIIKMDLLQGKKMNIKDADKRWVDKMEVEVSFVTGSGDMPMQDEQELKIVKIIASDKMTKILKNAD